MPKDRLARPFLALACAALASSVFPAARAADATIAPGMPSAPAPSAAPDLLHQLDHAFEAVFEKVAPAVVVIDASKKDVSDGENQGFDFNFHSPESEEGVKPRHGHPQSLPDASVTSEGSGFIVRPDGFIYTNNHVIEDADKIDVRLRDGRHFPAKVVGADDGTDIAVLKIDAKDLPTVTLLDSDSIRVGQLCFAIGIPYDLDYSFSGGFVSAKGRGNLTSTPTKPMYEDYIQTDAFINPGNSGGPLFDVDGRIMGMNTLINGIGRGLAFAIPANMLHDIGNELIATGKITRPWLGVRIQSLADNANLSEHFQGVNKGVYVDTIEAEAPAYKSDLRPYDVITQVDGVAVNTAHDLQHEILRKKVGQSVSLAVWRDGRTINLPVVTGELPRDLSQTAAAQPVANAVGRKEGTFGVHFQDAHAGSKTVSSDGDAFLNGAAVVTVAPGSLADQAGLQPGDVVTDVDQKPVSDAAACRALLAAHRGSRGILLFLDRKGQKTHAVLDLGASAPATRDAVKPGSSE